MTTEAASSPTAWSLASTLSGRHFSELFRSNVLLAASATRHSTHQFSGPLSIKGVMRGEAAWTVAGKRHVVDSTSCIVVGHHEPYDLEVSSPDPVETFVIFFADALATDVLDCAVRPVEQLLHSPTPGAVSLPDVCHRLWTEDQAIYRALRELRTCAMEPLEQGEVDRHLRMALDSLFAALRQVHRERLSIDAARPSTQRELHRRVLQGKAYLDSNTGAPFDLGRAAREACLSPHHFHRTFRSVFRRTPFAYVTERRIARAKRLLTEKDWDVSEVSATVGYQSVPSFTRLFKRQVGATPTAFRSKVRNSG